MKLKFTRDTRSRWKRRQVRRARLTELYAPPLKSFGMRLRAWANMLFLDHGLPRIFYLNLHPVGRDGFRSAQPAPHQIRRAARMGVKTIVNLRGGRDIGSYPLEWEACRDAGLAFEEVKLRSRDAPEPETIEEVAALLSRIEYPALFHCKSGADRAGLMSVLYLLLHEERSLEEAMGQLSPRYGHFRQSPTGVIDAFFDAYAKARDEAAAEGRRLELLEWVRGDYDKTALKAGFKPTGWGRFVVDVLLRRE